jgi:Protein of unknown function (DUF4238)
MKDQSNFSTKHHYLPVFYLKGFSNKKQLLNIYDKSRDAFLTNQNPKSIFYVNHLNNFRHNKRVKMSLEERLFTPLDTKAFDIFEKIRNFDITEKDPLTPIERFSLLHYLIILYWRSPFSDNNYLEIIKREGFLNKYFSATDSNNKELTDADIPDMLDSISANGELIKIFKHTVSYSNGPMKEIYELYDKWHPFSILLDTPSLITGDKPFLINNSSPSIDKTFDELIFNISHNRLLILSDNAPKFIDKVFMTQINIAILQQSDRFVVHHDINYLRNLVSIYKQFESSDIREKIVPATFSMMRHRFQFETHEAFYEDYMQKVKHS